MKKHRIYLDTSAPISKALAEVWEWKEETFNDIKNMCFEEKAGILLQGLKRSREVTQRQTENQS